nr:MAG TPA: hypothetical protein [Caudoviricetes sp.]
MTLEENKKIALALIEEYSPNNIYLTDDEDISNRLNLVYSPAYQELSQIKKILKTIIIREIEGDIPKEVLKYELPDDMYQFKQIVGIDKDNKFVNVSYRKLGKNLVYIDNLEDIMIVLEYYSYPQIITEKTKNDYELEIDQDVQLILPYAVANDILKVDPSSDYTAFYTEYKRKLESLDTRNSSPSVNLIEGLL